MIYLFTILILIQILISSYLLLPFLLLSTTYIINKFTIKSTVVTQGETKKSYKFGVVITAYQETTFILPVVDSLLKQKHSNFQVYVVADDCNIDNVYFDDTRVHILKPQYPLKSNTKSIQYAIDHFDNDVDVLVIFDPDNLVHPRFLSTLNYYYNAGYKAVQGKLRSKNNTGTYERMDYIGVIFYRFIDSYARMLLGLSVNTRGCGVSVLLDVYNKISYDNRSNMGGFDKRMQIEIAKNVSVIAYAPEALLYDEQVADSKNLVNQRARWINSYFNFLSDSFSLFICGLKSRNFNLIFFGYNLLRPPYFLQILLALIFMVFNIFLNYTMFIYWAVVLFIFLCSFTIIIMKNKETRDLRAVWYMPLFFMHQIFALIKIRMNKKSILKTEHFKVIYINEILEAEAC